MERKVRRRSACLCPKVFADCRHTVRIWVPMAGVILMALGTAASAFDGPLRVCPENLTCPHK